MTKKKFKIIYTKQMAMYNIIKWTVSRDFLLQGFYHESSSSMPLKIILGSFSIFSKIRGDIQILKSGCNTSINNTGGKQWEQYQTAYTLKGAWIKNYVYVNSTSQRCPNQIIKFFLKKERKNIYLSSSRYNNLLYDE